MPIFGIRLPWEKKEIISPIGGGKTTDYYRRLATLGQNIQAGKISYSEAVRQLHNAHIGIPVSEIEKALRPSQQAYLTSKAAAPVKKVTKAPTKVVGGGGGGVSGFVAAAEPVAPKPSFEDLINQARAKYDKDYQAYIARAPTFTPQSFDEALVEKQVKETSGFPEYYQRLLSQHLEQSGEEFGQKGLFFSGLRLRSFGQAQQESKETELTAIQQEILRRKAEEFEPAQEIAQEQYQQSVLEPYLSAAPKLENYLLPTISSFLS